MKHNSLDNQYHIIHSVNLDISTSSLEKANKIKDTIDLFFKEKLFPRIEKLLENKSVGNEIKRFDKVNIDLDIHNTLDYDDLKTKITDQLSSLIDNLDSTTYNIRSRISQGKEGIVNDIKSNTLKSRVGFTDDKPAQQIIPDQENREEIFIYFLRTGRLPWFAKESDITRFYNTDLYKKSFNSAIFIDKLRTSIVANYNVLERLIYQFPDDFLNDLLICIVKDKVVEKEFLKKRIRNKGVALRDNIYKVLFTSSLPVTKEIRDRTIQKFLLSLQKQISINNQREIYKDYSSDIEKVTLEIEELINHVSVKKVPYNSLKTVLQNISIQTEKSDNILDESVLKPAEIANQILEVENNNYGLDDAEDNAILTENVGLILLHPFLKQFFKELEITDKNGNLIDDKIDNAIHILHYLATGEENVLECNLTFEKIICAIPIETPIQRGTTLSVKMKEDADQLLKAAIKNWSALKNTSPDGLRQLFLERDGKVFEEESKYKIIVERKAQDILLGKLPWNISIIRLPWQSKILFVQW